MPADRVQGTTVQRSSWRTTGPPRLSTLTLVGWAAASTALLTLYQRRTKMPSINPPHRRNRGVWNALHQAIVMGSERTVAVVLDGPVDIDQADHKGRSPLMMASTMDHSHVVRILLNKGANVAMADDAGFTALHTSAQEGSPAITKMLVEAGADLEAAENTKGASPLHLATENGHSQVMSVLIEAGADLNSRRLDGATPLFMAAQGGLVDAVRMLLRAKANPLLAAKDPAWGVACPPLIVAAMQGHSEVVHEMIQQVGIEGCGGENVGLCALCTAAGKHCVETLAVLTDAGVVDDGEALATACACGSETSVKFLLQQVEGRASRGSSCLNFRDRNGQTPLLSAVMSASPRIVRLLVDAGADTTSACTLSSGVGRMVLPNETALAVAARMLREKKIDGNDAMEKQLHKLERIRRLLLRVEAVHAVSFLWPGDAPFALTAEGTRNTITASSPLRKMLPFLRRNSGARGVLLATQFRHSQKAP